MTSLVSHLNAYKMSDNTYELSVYDFPYVYSIVYYATSHPISTPPFDHFVALCTRTKVFDQPTMKDNRINM